MAQCILYPSVRRRGSPSNSCHSANSSEGVDLLVGIGNDNDNAGGNGSGVGGGKRSANFEEDRDEASNYN